MEDKISEVNNNELIYEVLDKICLILKGNKYSSDTITLHRESTHKGMKIKIFAYKRELIMDCDLTENKIDFFIDPRNIRLQEYDFINIATLYKDNSESCKNFLEQVIEEDKKIHSFLDELLKDLDKLEPPKEPKLAEKDKSTKPKKFKWFTSLWHKN